MPTSTNFAGNGSNDTGPGGANINWGNFSNISADDGNTVDTALTMAQPDVSYFCIGDTFGHSIPAGSTIDGIELNIERTANSVIDDNEIRLSGVTAGLTTAKTSPDSGGGANWSASAVVTYGSSTDTWGKTWTVSEINASTFAGLLSCKAINIFNFDATKFDYMETVIHYTTGGGGAGRSYEIRFGDKVVEEVRMGNRIIDEIRFGNRITT